MSGMTSRHAAAIALGDWANSEKPAIRARFQIKTGGSSGTLIEVLFPHAMARA